MDETRHSLELLPENLRRITDPASLGFETTRDLPAPQHMAGQSRAQEAIDFALEITDSRYNLYVAGSPGTGRRLALMLAVERVARERPAAQDWCYVANFEQSDEPRAVALPAGLGRTFAQDVDALVLASRRSLQRAFSSDDYDAKRRAILRDLETGRDRYLEQAQQEALTLGFAVR
nr:AAA family ATPase [Ktedonobacterales bacterium]